MLIDLIRDLLPATASEVADALADVVEVNDETPKTVADVVAVLTEPEELLVLGTIRAARDIDPRVDGAWIAMNVGGIVLHTDERQTMIDTLAAAGNWSSELKAKVKSLGRPQMTEWARRGGTGEVPTEQEIQEAIDAEDLLNRKQEYRSRFDAILNQYGTSEVMQGVAALRDIADEWEGV